MKFNKRSFLPVIFASSILMLFLLYGCGTNPTGGGGGGGGGGGTSFSADIYVSTTGSDETGDGSSANPYETIQKGLDSATHESVVGLFNGTYSTPALNWPMTAESVTLRGESRDGVIITSTSTDKPALTLFGQQNHQTVTVESLTFSDCENQTTGGSEHGGAIYVDNDDGWVIHLNVRNAAFTSNEAEEGAAIYAGGSSDVTIDNCGFTGNAGTGDGSYGGTVRTGPGGTLTIYSSTFESNSSISTNASVGFSKGGAVNGYEVFIRGCTFNDNFSYCSKAANGFGGAVYLRVATKAATIEGTTFSGNTAEADGGAIYIDADKVVDISNCTFTDNIAGDRGGAIFDGGALTASKCGFNGNIANSPAGGGMAFYGSGGGKLENCLIYNNKAPEGAVGIGGGIYHNSSVTLEVINCTLVSNEADAQGGGIQGCAFTYVINSIFWGNKAGMSPDWRDIIGSSCYVEYSDLEKWHIGISGGPGTIEGVDPLFAHFPPSVNTDLKPSGSVTQVTEGATTEGAPADDFDGSTRTVPYSMGAYELN